LKDIVFGESGTGRFTGDRVEHVGEIKKEHYMGRWEVSRKGAGDV